MGGTGSGAGAGGPAVHHGHLLASLLVVLLVAGLAFAPRLRGTAAAATEPEAVAWIDPASARVGAAPEWTDPRWLEHLQALLGRLDPFPVDAPGDLEPLRSELAALSFVERVERLELTPAGELALDLTLRRPVACIPCRGEFALVDGDGVVLEGRWPLPPRLGRAYLPVLGPRDDPLFARARSGDWLSEPEHLDALDVALSLQEHLGADERAGLGRVLIDARTARVASLSEPGIRLELPGERLALFGRAPGANDPGELAPAAKWRSLERAVELFEQDPAAHDWELVDLRWDRPDLALRSEPVVALAETRASGERGQRARDDSRPHVR